MIKNSGRGSSYYKRRKPAKACPLVHLTINNHQSNSLVKI